MGSSSRRAPPARTTVVPAALADPGEQLGSGDPKPLCELRDSTDARLALTALDLRDMRHVQVRAVSETLLAETTLSPQPSHVRSEDIERVAHNPTMVRHLSQ